MRITNIEFTELDREHMFVYLHVAHTIHLYKITPSVVLE